MRKPWLVGGGGVAGTLALRCNNIHNILYIINCIYSTTWLLYELVVSGYPGRPWYKIAWNNLYIIYYNTRVLPAATTVSAITILYNSPAPPPPARWERMYYSSRRARAIDNVIMWNALSRKFLSDRNIRISFVKIRRHNNTKYNNYMFPMIKWSQTYCTKSTGNRDEPASNGACIHLNTGKIQVHPRQRLILISLRLLFMLNTSLELFP